ncbi:MAG: hypothetical protein BBJ57_11725 [Desulfobacterales bacterium PC51MH44]|nr:MAG: hypothetical protein BBJ57_11725 [Desulfobacterales bacterium PC51MH44]
MLIHDGIYSWSGWGGRLSLGSGKCRLRIYDLKKSDAKGLTHLRPIIVVVSDVPESSMSVRSCTSHIATLVAKDFNLDPHRMLWIEYYPEKTYGVGDVHVIPEKFDAVEFTWHEDNAVQPKWRSLKPPLLDTIRELISD